MRIGAIRRTDANGRVQIPSEIREYLGLDDNDLNIYMENGKVIIERMNKVSCSICGLKFIIDSTQAVDINVCPRCAEKYGG